MASIKMSALVTAIAGKTGGTVFRRGKQGMVMQNSPNSTGSPQSSIICVDLPIYGHICCASWNGGASSSCNSVVIKIYLYQARRGVTSSASHWKTLSAEDMLSWQTGASSFPRKNKFGDVYTPSGYQLFCELNGNLKNAGLFPIAVCPLPVTLSNDYNPLITTNTNNITNVALEHAIRSTEMLQIMVTASTNKGRSSNQGGYKMIAYISQGSQTLLDISNLVAMRFPFNLSNAQVLFKWRIMNVATGITSAWSYGASNTVEGVDMSALISSPVTTTFSVTTAHVTTTTANCVTANLYKIPYDAFSFTPTLVAALTANTTTTTDVVITEDTIFLLTATDTNGFISQVMSLAKMPS